jgi:hypothetical protein
MKKSIFVLVTVFAVLTSGCTRKSKDFVYLGQMKGTPGFAAQEKIKGKVKEFKETFFWAQEINGKIEKGKRINQEDLKTNSLNNECISMTEEFSPSGIVLRSTLFNENGGNFQDYIVEAEGKLINRFLYKVLDTVRVYGICKYEGENPVLATAYDAKTDTVMMILKYEYDQNGNITKTQTLNYRNEPASYTLWNRDLKGNLVKVQYFSPEGNLFSQFDYTYNNKGERITQHQQNNKTGLVIDYTFTYEYDKMGNYTAIIYHKDGKPFIYCEREIKYYD